MISGKKATMKTEEPIWSSVCWLQPPVGTHGSVYKPTAGGFARISLPSLTYFLFFYSPSPLFFRKGNTFYRDFWGYYIQSTSPFAHALHQLLHKIVSQCRVTKGEGHLAGKLYRNQNGGERKKLRNDNGNQMSLYIVMERSGKVLEIKFIFY